MDFQKELEQLINKYSKENDSNTPDFILADYVRMSLYAFNHTVNSRERWYGRSEAHIKKPTIEELETMLNDTKQREVVMNPDGSITTKEIQ